MNNHGINYKLPKVTLLNESGLGTAEYAARTCYDSFASSENESIAKLDLTLRKNVSVENSKSVASEISHIHDIQDSELLRNLAWVHHHHSILEHASLTFLIQGTSRGVLQEHARHRIQSISVRSTRYTMSSLINAFVASLSSALKLTRAERLEEFIEIYKADIKNMDFLVVSDAEYIKLELTSIWSKLHYQRLTIGYDEFIKLSVAKSSLNIVKFQNEASPIDIYRKLQAGKNKRNVGDPFKHIVSDNWKVDMVVTFNIRSLKNYFHLRDSGAAWFQIQWLAKAMKEVTPNKYLKLIDKNFKEN